MKNFTRGSLLTDYEVIERKNFSNLADNIIVTVCLEFLSLILSAASVLLMSSLPDHVDFIITGLFCESNIVIMIIQFVNLNRERRMFEGKERLGFVSWLDAVDSTDDADLNIQREKGVLSKMSSASLVDLVTSKWNDDNYFIERDRQRVLNAWSSSKHRAYVEISDREYGEEKGRDGLQ